MKLLALAVCLFFLGSGLASAQELFPLQQVQQQPQGTQPACMPGCAPPSGYHWSLVDGWDAEFNQGPNGPGVGSLGGFENTWNPTYSGTGGYFFDANGLNLTADCSNGGARTEVTLAPNYPTTGALAPVGSANTLNYGIYEARMRESTNHNDFWWRSNEGSANAETDIAEVLDGPSTVSYGVFDPIGGATNPGFDYPGNTDLTAAFYTYDMVWSWDGSPHGSETVYFDGTQQGPSYNLQSSDWDYGVHQHFSTDGPACSPPYAINYFRYWKQMPN